MAGKRATSVDLEVGHRIRLARLQCGMSQTDLADKIGVTFQQVQKYEKGTNRVGAGRLSQVAAALNRHITDFFDDTREPKTRADSPSASALLSEPYVLRLVNAFGALTAVGTQRSIVHLVEAMAKSDTERPTTRTGTGDRSTRRPAKRQK
jgi:transcriptional regulator with XRE-family HTH domain